MERISALVTRSELLPDTWTVCIVTQILILKPKQLVIVNLSIHELILQRINQCESHFCNENVDVSCLSARYCFFFQFDIIMKFRFYLFIFCMRI